MSDTPVEGTEPEPEATEPQQQQHEEYPPDHPLVKRLEALKAELKEAKPKAKRLTELEEASKSDAEKAADRIAKAEAEAATVPNKVADALRGHLIEMHSIDPQDAELFLTATDPELLLKQVARLVESSPRSKRNHVPREGTNHQTTESDERLFASELFGG